MNSLTTVVSIATVFTLTLAFASLGELTSQRAGAVNVSVEAMMLAGAFASIYVAGRTGNGLASLLAGSAAGLAVGFVQAILSHYWSANQFVVGLALNILVLGVTSFLLERVDIVSFTPTPTIIPGLSSIPVVGKAFFERPWPAYLIAPLAAWIYWLLHRSRWGLEVRSVGEDAEAAELASLAVGRRRRQAVVLCGFCSGLGGAHLAIADVGTFTQNMTAGTGYLVIAAVLFGRWRMPSVLGACALFGASLSLRVALPALGHEITPELLIALPYLLALAALVAFSRTDRQPGSLARPFTPSSRIAR